MAQRAAGVVNALRVLVYAPLDGVGERLNVIAAAHRVGGQVTASRSLV